jgi:hypothetical protein
LKVASRKEKQMASFKSILSDIGNGFKKFFGIAVTVAQDAEPIIDIAFPGISSLYNLTVTEVAKAEAAALAAGQQSGTGAQKLAMVIEAITPVFQQYAASSGIPTASQTATITNWVNAVVASLNVIPAATPPTS